MLSVEPGAAEGQTGVSPQSTDVLNGVLIRIFGMNGFASGEINRLSRFGDSHVLRPATAQVHLDASVLLVVEGKMDKGRHMKIGPEFAVHPVQQVQIEGGCHSLSIIVRR